jgi:hypothetical protein
VLALEKPELLPIGLLMQLVPGYMTHKQLWQLLSQLELLVNYAVD